MNDNERHRAMSMNMGMSNNTGAQAAQVRTNAPKHTQIIRAIDGLDNVMIALSALSSEVMGSDNPIQEASQTNHTSLTDMLNNSAEVIERKTEEMVETISELRTMLLGSGR